ncbi:tyrosine-type recombinase/integrase [Bosea sp. PAMC 26642]|uniref:tyrosine-type recombinase/integrase n=1 Tax=Bosea sp. (strain PAMC 26642) TaxID=1792307 RepID=UPI000770653D|nr:site-specific integrase [Bosea sp. PAMC 26642]AMJ63408.1 integrase [Bosea sp. PAMC 26642]
MTEPGRHSDGGGLYLVVDPSGAKRWLFMFRMGSTRKEMGLGSLSAVSLAEAREKAAASRKMVDAGTNPIVARKSAEAMKDAASTFGEFTDALLPTITKGFRNPKHRDQWPSTLKMYAASLRPMKLDAIGTAEVLEILKPIWLSKAETASRLRGRIEHILAAASAQGLRTGENPARWRHHLDKLLPKRAKLTRGHHAAMPYGDVPAFVQDLRRRDALAARALEFLILTACRSGEVREATWAEIDLGTGIWTIPAPRMKAGRPHRVPLTDRALDIVRALHEVRQNDLVFPGGRKDRPLSSNAIVSLMRRMEASQFTPHGFRSSFRDWAGESTTFPREVAEAALAHVVGDQTERAYRRGDALAKRRELMDAWSRFASAPKADNITPIRAKGSR